MSEIPVPVIEKRPRLKFIDMARSIAILLMLEGHFIKDSLQLKGYVNGVWTENMYAGNPFYETWAFIRGFTAPVFLTVTGLIFVYLLLWKRKERYFSNDRVKKGYSRGVELIFWGYLLDPNNFHVLQCMGYGIIIILLIFGLYKSIRVIPLWIYYLVAALAIFAFGIFLIRLPEDAAWPANAPMFIQKMFHGGKGNPSLFPLAPWLGYTMIGAMIGCLLHDLSAHVKKWGFALTFIAVGALFYFFATDILMFLDKLISGISGGESKLVRGNWILDRVGMVFMELGVLMVIEKLIGEMKQNLFLKIGQNTLSVFIVHNIVLYGSITHYGLTRLFRESLNPYEVVLGAVLFILLFLIFVKYIEPMRAVYNKILSTILPWKYKKPEKQSV